MALDEIFNFPCEYPFKIFGRPADDFSATVVKIFRRHACAFSARDISKKYSANKKYLSLTVRIIATDKPQLDAIYRDLQKCPAVILVL